MSPIAPFEEVGSSGTRKYGGRVYQEYLRELQGVQGQRVFKEMRENDAIIGAVMYAIEMFVREVDWWVEPAREEEPYQEAAQFVEECRTDMSDTWEETVIEIFSMLVYGWSLHEIVYKRRIGPDAPNSATRSRYTDGLIGWRKFPIRSQESMDRWEFDEEDDGVMGMWQRDQTTAQPKFIPIEKALLFRTTPNRRSPEGRALDPTTPIPTPDGWKKLGALAVGDRVFDETGAVRHVAATARWQDRPRYRVEFADGTSIVADAEHLWLTKTLEERSARANGQVRTTAEMAESAKTRSGSSNHTIARARPLNYVAQWLPVDPYVLGLWLGDGNAASACLTVHVDDVAAVKAGIEARGYPVIRVAQNGRSAGLGRIVGVGGELQAMLRMIGLLGNKHVPEPYLRGDVEQRRQLLAGLLDADGHCDPLGRVEFVNTNRSLIDAVAELARSLGYDARVSLRRKAVQSDERGKRRSIAWAVRFSPDEPVFGLGRKNAKLGNGSVRAEHHYVRAVVPLDEPGETVCIEVDSPSHLFLAGEGMVPTHNSILRNAYRPWYFAKRMEEIEGIGIERDLAGLPVITPPEDVDILDTEDDDAQAARESAQGLVNDIRRDEAEGIVKPFGWELELLSTGGKRQIDISGVLERYDRRKAMTMLGDVIMIGHEAVGSKALSESKVEGLFAKALGGFLDVVAAIFNVYAIPRLMRFNPRFPQDEHPTIHHGDTTKVDLTALAAFMESMTRSGLITPGAEIEAYLRSKAGLPAKPEDADEGVEEAEDREREEDDDTREKAEDEPEIPGDDPDDELAKRKRRVMEGRA